MLVEFKLIFYMCKIFGFNMIISLAFTLKNLYWLILNFRKDFKQTLPYMLVADY